MSAFPQQSGHQSRKISHTIDALLYAVDQTEELVCRVPRHRSPTQEEIAQLVVSSREATNQALGTFADRGWIQSESHNMLILDAENLVRRAR
jgi:hypothetical protein